MLSLIFKFFQQYPEWYDDQELNHLTIQSPTNHPVHHLNDGEESFITSADIPVPEQRAQMFSPYSDNDSGSTDEFTDILTKNFADRLHMKPYVLTLKPVNPPVPKRNLLKAPIPIITEDFTPIQPEHVPFNYADNENVLTEVATDYEADNEHVKEVATDYEANEAFNSDRGLPIHRPIDNIPATIEPSSEIEDPKILHINIGSNDAYNVFLNQGYKMYDVSGQVQPDRPLSPPSSPLPPRSISPPRLFPKSQLHTQSFDIENTNNNRHHSVYQSTYPQTNEDGYLHFPHNNSPIRSIDETTCKYNSPPRPSAPKVPAFQLPIISLRAVSPIIPSKQLRFCPSDYQNEAPLSPDPHPIHNTKSNEPSFPSQTNPSKPLHYSPSDYSNDAPLSPDHHPTHNTKYKEYKEAAFPSNPSKQLRYSPSDYSNEAPHSPHSPHLSDPHPTHKKPASPSNPSKQLRYSPSEYSNKAPLSPDPHPTHKEPAFPSNPTEQLRYSASDYSNKAPLSPDPHQIHNTKYKDPAFPINPSKQFRYTPPDYPNEASLLPNPQPIHNTKYKEPAFISQTNPSTELRYNPSVYSNEGPLPHPHPIPNTKYMERHPHADESNIPNMSGNQAERQSPHQIQTDPQQPRIAGY